MIKRTGLPSLLLVIPDLHAIYMSVHRSPFSYTCDIIMHRRCCGNDERANREIKPATSPGSTENSLRPFLREFEMKIAIETPYTVSGTKTQSLNLRKTASQIVSYIAPSTTKQEAKLRLPVKRRPATSTCAKPGCDLRPEAVPAALRAFLRSDGFDVRKPTYDFRAHKGMTQTTLLGEPSQGKVNAKTSMAVRPRRPFNHAGSSTSLKQIFRRTFG